ncbi:uncharacterized protein LOC123987887 [Osmia bicornis bicornis]|uniref:uncharacterized protein LOC123987887 n=1 Tax=Osmia bicornis bicornis TaxID=1437191 RepID=UPI001EAEB91F|nr:uncharacterized protein LOC123987887 [Osmia bicornis bicornis]
MEWTEEIVLQLIENYRKHKILWDPQHPKYYHKIKKSDAWDKIAQELSIIRDECKKKMNALLSALRREKAKIKKSHGTGKGRSDVYESSWFAFNSLLFLWDKNKVCDTRSTIEKESDECSDVDNDTIDNLDAIDASQEDDEAVRTPLPADSINNQALVTPLIQRCATRKRKCAVDQSWMQLLQYC